MRHEAVLHHIVLFTSRSGGRKQCSRWPLLLDFPLPLMRHTCGHWNGRQLAAAVQLANPVCLLITTFDYLLPMQ